MNKDLLRSEKQVSQGLSLERADLYAQFSAADEEIYIFMRVGYDIPVGSEKYSEVFDKLNTDMVGLSYEHQYCLVHKVERRARRGSK